MQFNIVNKVSLGNSFINIFVFGIVFAAHSLNYYAVDAITVLVLSLIVLLCNTGVWYYFLFKLHSDLKPDFKISWKIEMLPVLKYLGIVHLSNIINFLNYRFSIWIIAIYLDTVKIGYYALAIGISGMLNLVTTPISTVLMPYLVSEDPETRKKIFVQYSRLNFTILLIAAVVGFVVAPFVIPLVYGELFAPSIVIFQMCLIGAVFSSQTRIWGIYNMANNKQSINLYQTIIGVLITVSGSFILIPWLGLIGATIGGIITYTSMFLFQNIVFLYDNKFKYVNVFLINKNDIATGKEMYKKKMKGNKTL
jgi:O-antigen/teichoic acid export membrane protein